MYKCTLEELESTQRMFNDLKDSEAKLLSILYDIDIHEQEENGEVINLTLSVFN